MQTLVALAIDPLLAPFRARLTFDQVSHRLGHFALDCAARALPLVALAADNRPHRELLQLCRRWLRSQVPMVDVIGALAALPVLPWASSWQRSTALFAELALRAFEPRTGAAARAADAAQYSALAGWAATGTDAAPTTTDAFDAEVAWQAGRLRERLQRHDLADWPEEET